MNLDILQQEPVDFIELAFNETLWEKQKEIAYSIRDNPRTTVKSCFDIGKSFISSRIVPWFLYSHPNSKVITTAPTFRQVKDILWREIHVAKSKAIVPLGGTLNDTSLDLGNDWFAMGFSSDKPTNFQGFHAVDILVIVDEAAGVPEPIFNSLEGLISSERAKLLYIGNPSSTEGTFFKSFRMPSYHHITISAFDTPNFTGFDITIDDIRNNTWSQKITKELPAPYLITPAWVYDKLLRWGETSPMFQALVLGEFPEQGDDTLIPLSLIEKARIANKEVLDTDPEVIGADLARYGADKTEYCYRKGPKPMDWRTITHIDTITNAGELKTFMDFHPKSMVNGDEGGLGVGIMDMVSANNPFKTVNGINSASEPHDKESFINIRAEMFFGLRDRFMSGDIDLSGLPQDIYEDLAAQLSNIKYKFTARGQRQIESKEDMKKRGLPSPDKADALALAFGNFAAKPALIDFMGGAR